MKEQINSKASWWNGRKLAIVCCVICAILLYREFGPNTIIFGKSMQGGLQSGKYVKIKATGDLVYIVCIDMDKNSWDHPWLCRIDHGPGTVPRYEERLFNDDELELLDKK